jgi:hypothetical protein
MPEVQRRVEPEIRRRIAGMRFSAFILVAAVCLAQDDDGGPPKLKRGRPEATRQTTSTSQANADTVIIPKTAATGTAVEAQPAPKAPVAEPADPFLEKARQAAASFVDGLPNFLCQEMMTRYQSDARPVNWRVIDTLTMDLVYEDHKEDYRNIKINGKATNKTLEESGGAWSTGDFGTMLGALFDEATEADFRSQGSDRIEGKDAIRYSVAVQQDRSGWDVNAEKEKITVAYKGTVWLERETGRTLRLEIQAERIPKDFPFNAVEWTVNYAYTRISGVEFLLPSRSETLSCSRGSRFCSRNVIDFRNYRRFGGDSTITFEQ